MKRKYKVFLSSTFDEFREARAKLIHQTLKLGHIPAGMELFQAGDAETVDVIEKEIASSDIFVVLVGSRLGSPVSENEHLTFVMREYDIAVKYKKPVIPLFADSDIQPDPLLRRFSETVQQRPQGGRRIAAFFSNDDDLCAKYGDALRGEVEHLEQAGTGGGWVEGRLFDALNARGIILGESASTNPFFQRFAARLGTFDKLSKRASIETRAKELIADYFWEQYMPRIDDKGITHIYFESGSSIAYASRSFIEYVREEEWFYERHLDSKLRLRTNNILTYLEFLLVEPPWRPMDIQLLPYGPFSHDYGATYGRLKSTKKMNSPRSADDRHSLSPDAAKEMRILVDVLNRSFAKAGLILMTTSGVDTRHDSPFPGPHVGSPYNMLMKRALLSVDCPKVIFLDGHKWGYPFRFNSCHPVCDAQFPWARVKVETPLAVALAVDESQGLDKVLTSLREHGFGRPAEVGELPVGEHTVRPIIAANERFMASFA